MKNDGSFLVIMQGTTPPTFENGAFATKYEQTAELQPCIKYDKKTAAQTIRNAFHFQRIYRHRKT